MALPNLSALSAHAVAPTGDFAHLSKNHAEKLNEAKAQEPLTLNEYKEGEYFRLLKPDKPKGSTNPNDYDWFEPEPLFHWVDRVGGTNPVNREPISEEDRNELHKRYAPDVPQPLTVTRARRQNNAAADDPELEADANARARENLGLVRELARARRAETRST